MRGECFDTFLRVMIKRKESVKERMRGHDVNNGKIATKIHTCNLNEPNLKKLFTNELSFLNNSYIGSGSKK